MNPQARRAQLSDIEQISDDELGQGADSTGDLPAINPVIEGIGDFLERKIQPRGQVLSPWLPTQGLAMLHASRGVGKTHVAIGIAWAVATGGKFFNWRAETPRGVLYLDGEMPASALQERFATLAASSEQEPKAPLSIYTPDLQPDGRVIDLARKEHQAAIARHLEGIELIVVDNLSTLTSGRENEADDWRPVQAWALQQRSAGRSVLLIHHDGKGGGQRGSSRKEDILDTVIQLYHASNYTPDQGAAFFVEFKKSRGFHGEDAASFEARLETDHRGRAQWTTKDAEASTFDRVLQLCREGLGQKDIAEELGVHKSQVSRHLKRAKEAGRISE